MPNINRITVLLFLIYDEAHWRTGEFNVHYLPSLACFFMKYSMCTQALSPELCNSRYILTLHIFSDGLCECLHAAGEVPGVLLDTETQFFGAVHLGLHLLLKL